ncbi:hypothetical protein A2291_03935 [candidate division WOR-1 bacterium RIFOXYB2_FULL_42_35]|uniref:YoaR-like putative peptidoglycan binding domain-containing protein n=1 Tax=candidate division WOR-1 bacterium RIFOXYC2_FULL_41_25 TaxID=1802586 RepID=A0A1F4TJB2_UNCSA|nr:MAG: hypothetical protein A2247_06145 [candidate division WOR-1 bacterium RIFOXYA2_FULL_41_14]OGC21971.1 MAG: hypothetical protein A2291_03935 [candidate division WOR-1 bacterium RIFOXYB2_FULL_42_35]OGC32805.1 MAG: hypothetical protein A2462_07190 [candidate division WOR-1 bacterium RIFOXYC2_FULL_41_25]
MNRLFKIFAFLALASFLVAVSFLSFDYLVTQDAFPGKTYISNVNISFLSKEQALEKINKGALSSLFSPLITLEADNALYSFAPEDLGITALYQRSVEQAFNATHQGKYFNDLISRLTKKGRFVSPLAIDIDLAELERVITALAPKIASVSREARVNFLEKTGEYSIEAEDFGRKLKIKESVTAINEALLRGEKNIKLVIDYTYPRITAEDLRENPPVYLLATYTTYYGKHDFPNRIHNIKLVASWIDGKLLMPGDRFSVANALGKVTKERGFKEAYVIMKGELIPLLGGGSCQIATTLYNAVSLADLKVLQRHNHSFYFNIYPLGRDATVFAPHLDFKFENDTQQPILIKASATKWRLSFSVYGTPSGKSVAFSSAKVFGKNNGEGKDRPMSLKKVIAGDLPFRTEVTRTVSGQDGEIIKEEKIISYYKLYGDKDNVPIRRPSSERSDLSIL